MDRNVCLSKDRELSIFPHIRWSIQYIVVYNTHQTKTYDQLFRDLVWWIFFPEQIIVESHIRLLWPNLTKCLVFALFESLTEDMAYTCRELRKNGSEKSMLNIYL